MSQPFMVFFPLVFFFCRAPGGSEKRETGVVAPQPSAGGWAKAVGVIGARSTSPIAPSNTGFGLSDGSLTLGAQRSESSGGSSSELQRTTSDPAGLNPDASAFRGSFLANNGAGDGNNKGNGSGLVGTLSGGAFSELSNHTSGNGDGGIDSMFGRPLLGGGSSLSEGGGGSSSKSSFMMGLFAPDSNSNESGLANSRSGLGGNNNNSSAARGVGGSGSNGDGGGGFFFGHGALGGGEGSEGSLGGGDDDDEAARDAEAFGDAPASNTERDLEARLRTSEEAEMEASRKCRQAERDRDEALVSLSRATAQLATKSSNSGGGGSGNNTETGGGGSEFSSDAQRRLGAADAEAKWRPKCEQLEGQVAALQRDNDALRKELAQLTKSPLPLSSSSSFKSTSPIASPIGKEPSGPTAASSGIGGIEDRSVGGLGGGVGTFDSGFNLGHLGGGLGGLSGFGSGLENGNNGGGGGLSDVDSMFGPSGSLGLDFGHSSSGGSHPSDSLLGSSGLNGSLLGGDSSSSSSSTRGSFGSGLGGFSNGNSGDQPANSTWTCQHCTFQNSGQADRGGSKICELCHMTSA